MFKCKCCEVLKAENDHLRGWIDRLMLEKAPQAMDEPLETTEEIDLEPDNGRITEMFGEH